MVAGPLRGWGVDAPDMGLLICGGKAAGQQWKGAVDMKEAKRAWWRVPVFCLLAGQVCFRFELALGSRFAIIRLSDGSVSVNNERWLLISAALFAATVLAGGLLFFRKRTRGELLFSAGVMFVLCAVWGLAAQLTQIGWLSIGYSESMAWCDVISQLLYRWNVNQWASAIVFWAAPFLFVPFGRREKAAEEPTTPASAEDS